MTQVRMDLAALGIFASSQTIGPLEFLFYIPETKDVLYVHHYNIDGIWAFNGERCLADHSWCSRRAKPERLQTAGIKKPFY